MKHLTHDQAGWIAIAIGVLALLFLSGCNDSKICRDNGAVETFGPLLVTDANGKLYVISRDGCIGRATRLEQKLEAQ